MKQPAANASAAPADAVSQSVALKVRPFVVRLPGFVADGQVGLGDAVKHVTKQMGLRSCGACARRAAALNRWIVFAGQRPG